MRRALTLTILSIAFAAVAEAQRIRVSDSTGSYYAEEATVWRASKRGPVRVADLPPGDARLMASDTDALYVVVAPADGEPMKLYAIPKGGGEPSLLASRIVAPKALKVDESFVYFDSDRGRERVTKDGWEREVVKVEARSR